jgi:hypothetical protein
MLGQFAMLGQACGFYFVGSTPARRDAAIRRGAVARPLLAIWTPRHYFWAQRKTLYTKALYKTFL